MPSDTATEPEATRSPAAGLIARTVALNLFQEVMAKNRSLDEAIADSVPFRQLEQRDRAFVRLLVTETLRRLGQIDVLIRGCLERPLPQSANVVRAILRLGVAQIVILKTPSHAVVDTAVRLCVRFRNPGHKGLVNAVMRRLAREAPDKYAAQDAARLNTPNWLWESWAGAYGEETCRRIAAAHLVEPPLDLTVKEGAEDWARKLRGEVLSCGTVRISTGGDIAALPGFKDGAWWVQDAAAALPARLLLSALDGPPGDATILDLCAAPGGKTAQLALSGARVIALDRSRRRNGILRENLKRLKLEAELVTADAAKWRPSAPPDAVLLDAPCTATGTIRRHPDIAGNKTPKDVARLAGIQQALLAAAARMLPPGGLLVYSVCSLQPEEGPAVVEAFLEQNAEFQRVPVTLPETGLEDQAITAAGDVRTLPYHLESSGGMDGFYIARLRRTP
jgi:16S rRNA (cytosine967-C5)-methyltransferase